MSKFHMESAHPPLNPALLRKGIKAHCSYTDWKGNLMPEFYRGLAERRKNGLTPDWWNGLVDCYFGGWKMLRPHPKQKIREQGLKHLSAMSKEYDKITHGASGSKKPSMETVRWEQVSGLFNVAMEIKQTKGDSAVFASKLCHFILPSVFGVIDNSASRIKPTRDNYIKSWEDCRQRWRECDCKDELKNILRAKFPHQESSNDRITNYPWAVKITQLCYTKSKTA